MTKSLPKIDYSRVFDKQLKRAPLKIKVSFRSRFKIFLIDHYNPILNNHQLFGSLAGYRSINITGDWRAIYSIYNREGKEVVVFEMLGTHSQLYK
jgi:addiction module RelE/StbE family toxin